MLPLKQRTIWKKDVSDGTNTLSVRIEKELLIAAIETAPKVTHKLEILSPAEDSRGRAIKKRMKITITRELLGEIKEGIREFSGLTDMSRRQLDRTIEVRCECAGSLVITREIQTHAGRREVQMRYVIGNGRDVRFLFDELSELSNLLWDLENQTP